MRYHQHCPGLSSCQQLPWLRVSIWFMSLFSSKLGTETVIKVSANVSESFASNWKSISVELKSPPLQVLERLRGKIDGIKIYDLLLSWGGADKANNFHPLWDETGNFHPWVILLWDETVVIFTLGLANFPAKRAHGGGGRSVLMSCLQHFCADSNFSLLYIKWASQARNHNACD